MQKFRGITQLYVQKKENHDKIEEEELNTIEVLISKAFIDPYISHDEFFSVNNVSREYNKMKKEIKNPETYV